MLHPFDDLFKDTLLMVEGEKALHPVGNQTQDLSITKPALYRCATTAAHDFSLIYKPY